MYLDNPIALPINSNPGMVFPLRESTNEAIDSFVRYVADFVSAILDYKELIDRLFKTFYFSRLNKGLTKINALL